MRIRKILEGSWRWLNSPPLLLGTLTFVALISLLALLLPQAPVPPANAVIFSRWLAESRIRLGPMAPILADLGLLSLRYSLWMRFPLALLLLIATARGIRLIEAWKAEASLPRLRHFLIVAGALSLLLGWGVQLRSGWMESRVTAWPGEPLYLNEHPHVLATAGQLGPLTWYGGNWYGIREARGLGLEVTARTEEGEERHLLPSVRSEPQQALRLMLTAQRPDGYFTITESSLVFRGTLLETAPDPKVQVQVYQRSSGSLITETEFQSSGILFTEDLRLTLDLTPLSQLRILYNPGAPLTLGGWLLLSAAGGLILVSHQQTEDPENTSKEGEG